MDLHLKQWRNQHESEQQQQPSAKIPKLLLDLHHQNQHEHASSDQPASALPLFVSSDQSITKMSNNMSAPLSDSNTRMGSYFSLAQWQELELQALIYRYMLAGAAVPPELLQPIKKSLLYSSTYFLHHPYSHYQPPLLQSGYWGRGAMDPEPGRCRRTDGKKWRCSRDVVTGQKYCERHVHRGRNRSRKPVEMPPTSSSTSVTVADNNAAARFGGGASGAGAIGCGVVKASPPMNASTFSAMANGSNNFGLSRPSPPIDLLQLNHSSPESKNEHKSPFEAQSDAENRSDGHILRHFFDDWPRTLQDPDKNGMNASPMSSATCLSISMPGNSSSDVSLKLSTGNGDQLGPSDSGGDHQQQPPMNWGMGGWAASALMGGPLAEALRSSSASNSSPTSVLHQLPRGSTSEISYVGT